ncbi:MAG: glycosyltransferase family 39 protein [Candidatus Eisenbacteria bacterium]|nr:glycosyltransferase family 39 protein [Candidatus Eisenbacteria bacterium]
MLTASPARQSASRRAALPLLPGLAVAAAAVPVFRGALGYGFSQDDFAGLARAAGLLPRLAEPWRFLSHQAFFDVMRATAGLDARPYHLASLALHAACALLLWVFLRRRLDGPAALAGAVFFAAHPALYTALYWISAIGDPGALLFALAALLALLRRDRWRWAALPLYALALLCKESVLLLPVAAAAVLGSDPDRTPAGRRAWRDPVVLSLALVAAAYLVYYLAADAMGQHVGGTRGSPYGSGLSPAIAWNALTYLGWSLNVPLPLVRSFSDAIDPAVYPWGAVALLLWLAGLRSRALRARGWLAAGALTLAFLAPVLPLEHHTYHYYLYAPLPGIAWCLAAALDAALARLRPTAAWVTAAALATALAVNGAALVRKVESFPFGATGLRADPTVDRARIATNALADLRAAGLPRGARLLFWSPIAEGGVSATPSPRESYWERNVRAALLDGLAVRVMLPQVGGVEFVRAFRPAPEPYRYAVYRPDGKLGVATPAELDSLIRANAGARGR